MLGGEPSAQSEVLSAVEQVFIEDISVLCSIQLSLDPVPAAEEQPHSMRLIPAHFTSVMSRASFLQTC